MTTPPFDGSATEPVPPAPVPVAGPEPVAAPPPPVAPEPEPVPVPAPPAPVVARPARRSSGGSRLVNIALGAALVVGVAGVAFAAGRVTAPASTGGAVVSVVDGSMPGGGTFPDGVELPDGFVPGNGELPGGGAQGNGQGGRGFVGFAAGPTIEGTVESVTGDSITVKLEDGQTITVGLDEDTTYHQQTDAEASDVATGKSVIVRLGGFRPGQGGTGGGRATMGSASDVTVVP
jgi:hypothetical protein